MHPPEDAKSLRLCCVFSVQFLQQIHDALIDERLRFDDVGHSVDTRNGPFERRMFTCAFRADETWVMHALKFCTQRAPVEAFRQRVLVRIDLVDHGWVGEHDCAWTDEDDRAKVSVELLDASACSPLVCVHYLEDVCKSSFLSEACFDSLPHSQTHLSNGATKARELTTVQCARDLRGTTRSPRPRPTRAEVQSLLSVHGNRTSNVNRAPNTDTLTLYLEPSW